jgi:tRNA A37 N6-isopentenylltransferase MiaA
MSKAMRDWEAAEEALRARAEKAEATIARIEALTSRLEEAGRVTGDPISPYIAEQLRKALRDASSLFEVQTNTEGLPAKIAKRIRRIEGQAEPRTKKGDRK